MLEVPRTRVKWTEIADRFTHIDASFVEADCSFGPDGASARYVVCFYPWWEHPDYTAAIESGEPWGFDDVDDAARSVTVYATNLVASRLSRRRDVIDGEDHLIAEDFELDVPDFAHAPERSPPVAG